MSIQKTHSCLKGNYDGHVCCRRWYGVEVGGWVLAVIVLSRTSMRCARRNTLLCVAVVCAAYLLVTLVCTRSCDDEPPCEHQVHSVLPALPHTYLLIVIYTTVDQHRLRQTIRDTWLKLSASGVDTWQYYFVIGVKKLDASRLRQLNVEHTAHSDLMLLDDHEEGYEQLTRKTLRTYQKAIKTVRFNYVLKVDSDSFVRVSQLLRSLKDISHPHLYWGFIDGRAPVHKTGKWMERDWVLCDRYLPYALGGGYVLAYDLVQFIAANARYFKIYNSEDVSVGAWLGGIDVHYVHDPRFDTEWTSRGCNNEYLVTHKQTESDMHRLFEHLRDHGRLCAMEFRRRNSYVYDWSLPPSQCCKRLNSTKIP